jgi:hypothetical protein
VPKKKKRPKLRTIPPDQLAILAENFPEHMIAGLLPSKTRGDGRRAIVARLAERGTTIAMLAVAAKVHRDTVHRWARDEDVKKETDAAICNAAAKILQFPTVSDSFRPQ